MSYPYMNWAFGLPVLRKRERILGDFSQRNLTELFNAADVPSITVEQAEYSVKHSMSFGINSTGYTEYMTDLYYYGVGSDVIKTPFKNSLLSFHPDELEILNYEQAIEDLRMTMIEARQRWDLIVANMQPSDLLWSYLSEDGLAREPRLLKLTGSS